MEKVRTNAGQTLGIIGLVLGILTLFIGFIPCIGLAAIAPGILAIILSIIGLVQANRNNGARGLNISALIVSIIGVLVASIWIFVFVGLSTLDDEDIHNIVEDVIEDVMEESGHSIELMETMEELEEHFDEMCVDSIKIKTDSVEIKVKVEVETKNK